MQSTLVRKTHTLRFSVFSTVVMNINALSVVVCIMLALAKTAHRICTVKLRLVVVFDPHRWFCQDRLGINAVRMF